MAKIDPTSERFDPDLERLLAAMPEEEPPPGMIGAVMRRIEPKKPGLYLRLRVLVRKGSPIGLRPLPLAVASMGMVLGLAFFYAWLRSSDPMTGNAGLLRSSGGRAVTLVLDRPSALQVAVIGSFNHWNPKGYSMHRDSPDAPWKLTVTLSNGRHAYAFLVDGHQVIADPQAIWKQDDGFGGQNSTIMIADGTTHEDCL